MRGCPPSGCRRLQAVSRWAMLWWAVLLWAVMMRTNQAQMQNYLSIHRKQKICRPFFPLSLPAFTPLRLCCSSSLYMAQRSFQLCNPTQVLALPCGRYCDFVVCVFHLAALCPVNNIFIIQKTWGIVDLTFLPLRYHVTLPWTDLFPSTLYRVISLPILLQIDPFIPVSSEFLLNFWQNQIKEK